MASSFIDTSLASDIGLDAGRLPQGVLAIYVFGSYTRGVRTSDVDLIVVWDADMLAPLEAADLRAPVRDAVTGGNPIDVVLLAPREFAEAHPILTAEAVPLYQREA